MTPSFWQFDLKVCNIPNLNNNSDDTLQTLQKDCFRTPLRGLPGAVADGVLRLDAEEEGRREVMDRKHTRLPVVLLLLVG